MNVDANVRMRVALDGESFTTFSIRLCRSLCKCSCHSNSPGIPPDLYSRQTQKADGESWYPLGRSQKAGQTYSIWFRHASSASLHSSLRSPYLCPLSSQAWKSGPSSSRYQRDGKLYSLLTNTAHLEIVEGLWVTVPVVGDSCVTAGDRKIKAQWSAKRQTTSRAKRYVLPVLQAVFGAFVDVLSIRGSRG